MKNDFKKRIITADGLFYCNYFVFNYVLATIQKSDNYSEYLIRLRDNYGIKVREPHYSNAEMPTDSRTIGVYIVNYKKYLSDIQKKLIELNIKDNIEKKR